MIQRAVVEAVVDWFLGPEGVNAQLHALPLAPGDAGLPPDIDAVLDPFRDAHAARFDTPPKARTIYVLPDGPVPMAGEVATQVRAAQSVAVAARYIVKLAADPAGSRREASYYQRAMEKALAAFLADTPTGDAARTRGDYRIVSANAILAGPWSEGVGEATAILVVGVDFEVHDRNARPAPAA